MPRKLLASLLGIVFIIGIGLGISYWYYQGTLTITTDREISYTIDTELPGILSAGSTDISLKTGNHIVRFQKDKYQDQEYSFEISPRSRQNLNISLIFDPVISQSDWTPRYTIPDTRQNQQYHDNQFEVFSRADQSESIELSDLPFSLASGTFHPDSDWAIIENEVGKVRRNWLYNISDSKSLPLQNNIKVISFTQAGDQIVYFKQTVDGGKLELGELSDQSSSTITTLSGEVVVDHLLSNAPGKAVFTLSSGAGSVDLYLLDLDARRKTKLLEDRPIVDIRLVPDTQLIILAENSGDQVQSQLSIYDLETRTETLLAIQSQIGSLAFSGDGTYLIAVEDSDTQSRFIRYDLTSQEKTLLTETDPITLDFLRLSEDEKTLYFSAGGLNYEMQIGE